MLTGCVTLDQCSMSWLSTDSPNHGAIAQVSALWADGVDIRPDPMQHGAPTAGFAGRVYLFGADCKEAFAAEGTLSIQLFDDAQPPSTPALPREVWNIDEVSLPKAFTKDALGWGYNLWLPWNNYQPEIKRVALVVLYRPKNGKEIWSGSTILNINKDGKPRPAERLKVDKQSTKNIGLTGSTGSTGSTGGPGR
jgi:hypothetical protein